MMSATSVRNVMDDLTEESQNMLAAIHIAQRLACVLAMTRFDLLVNFVELLAFEPVEKDAAERLVEVLLHTSDDFFQDIGIRGARSPVVGFRFVVFIEKLGYWCRRWYGGELLFFSDFLPVVNEY